MLYEVITDAHCGRSLPHGSPARSCNWTRYAWHPGKAAASRNAHNQASVRTSYSIHYTKLYEYNAGHNVPCLNASCGLNCGRLGGWKRIYNCGGVLKVLINIGGQGSKGPMKGVYDFSWVKFKPLPPLHIDFQDRWGLGTNLAAISSFFNIWHSPK